MAMAVGVKAGETIPEEDSKTQIKADGEMTIMAKGEAEETTTDLPKIKAAEEATATTAKIKAAMEVDQEMVVRWEADTTKDTEVALCDNLEAETETHLMRWTWRRRWLRRRSWWWTWRWTRPRWRPRRPWRRWIHVIC